jgi:hypothetical protein
MLEEEEEEEEDGRHVRQAERRPLDFDEPSE